MVGLECFAGLAAPAAGGVKATFEYNRGNFLFDRKCRQRKELQLYKFRAEQGLQWRDDVRDLISLTETKMHVYLLVNVLLLGFTVALWCEGRLPEATPNWLMMGSAVSIAGAFMFLLLSIWFAMHAAVMARSYEARLLTQMVRLPLPTWHELEACRTNGSDFERVESRQMFRVPFIMGRQEKLVRQPTGAASSTGATLPGLASGATDAPSTAADPWGLERCGDDIVELGRHESGEVAKLRHIRLTRQAMSYWQTHDAFARISMSIGVIELLLAMSYYVLGYVLVQDGCRSAATYGVILLTSMAVSITKMDMTLPAWESIGLQLLLFFVPTMSCVATYHWSTNSPFGLRVAEMLIVIAFFSHSVFLGLMTMFARITPQENGTLLPVAFRSVLYLDAFGWSRNSHDLENLPRFSTSTRLPPHLIAGRGGEIGDYDGNAPFDQDREGSRTLRPSVESLRYRGDGLPAPRRPEDFAPATHAHADLRDLDDAPKGSFHGGDKHSSFYKPEYWLPGSEEFDVDAELMAEQEETDNGQSYDSLENDRPGVLPWRVFSSIMICLCAAWLAASAYHGLVVLRLLKPHEFITYQMEPSSDEPWERRVPTASSQQQEKVAVTLLSLPFWGSASVADRVEPLKTNWPNPNVQPFSLACNEAGTRFAVTDRFRTFTGGLPEGVSDADASSSVIWSERATQPSRGTALLAVSEVQRGGLRSTSSKVVAAEVSKQKWPTPPTIEFQELACSALIGEGLQDVSISCTFANASDVSQDHVREGPPPQPECKALVLHRNGRRISACPMPGSSPIASTTTLPASSSPPSRSSPGQTSGLVANVSVAWLQVLRRDRSQAGGNGPSPLMDRDSADAPELLGRPHGAIEKTIAFSIDHACWDDAASEGCRGDRASESVAFAGTSHGRIVQLGRHSRRRAAETAELVPTNVLDEDGSSLGPGTVRTFGNRFVGILRDNGAAIQVLDVVRGGVQVGKIELPEDDPVTAFCVGGGHLFFLGRGPSPRLSHAPLPRELLANA
eukprot:TRINITY_DN13415_c0_g1_i1.p1 TRINITY_DN13415_c0_g1~~TRINITY_DN13415_c0_g1_i1.p1  ORF type:complete len:1016 (-),score=143.05 TRINITY_DN13415_c0_g1_i1:106-3153(-)